MILPASRAYFPVFCTGLLMGALFIPLEPFMQTVAVNGSSEGLHGPFNATDTEQRLVPRHQKSSMHSQAQTATTSSSLLGLPEDAATWLQLTEHQSRAIEALTSDVIVNVWAEWNERKIDERTSEKGVYSVTLEPLGKHGLLLREAYLEQLKQIVGERGFWVLWDNIRDEVNKRSGYFGTAERQLIVAKRPRGWEWSATDNVDGKSSYTQFSAQRLPKELYESTQFPNEK